MRHVVINSYEECSDVKLVIKALTEAAKKCYSTNSLDDLPTAGDRLR